MEEFKKRNAVETSDKEILFSRSVKAGKRIYYMDVKKNRKDEMFLAITESKKIVSAEGEDSQVSFEKHKIFLYKEDFEKFVNGLSQVIGFINGTQGFPADSGKEEDHGIKQKVKEEEGSDLNTSALSEEIKIEIDF